jgi:IS30 family transposase
MRKKYHKLTLEEREDLWLYRSHGKSLREIGKLMGRSHGSLSRELRRYSSPKHYTPCTNHSIAMTLKRCCGRKKVLAANSDIMEYVESKIKLGWSPEIISGRIVIDKPGSSISHETIYKYIYKHRWSSLSGFLPRRHIERKVQKHYGRNKQRSKIPNRLSIDKRPNIINKRKEHGHWESDILLNRINVPDSIHVMVERKSRYVQLNRIQDRTALTMALSVITKLSQYDSTFRRSITYDNGSENIKHEDINRMLGTISYFCNPYHSWEKGSVENTNGLIRRYISKKMDLRLVTDDDVKYIENQLNDRPKKILNYKTPREVFNSFL